MPPKRPVASPDGGATSKKARGGRAELTSAAQRSMRRHYEQNGEYKKDMAMVRSMGFETEGPMFVEPNCMFSCITQQLRRLRRGGGVPKDSKDLRQQVCQWLDTHRGEAFRPSAAKSTPDQEATSAGEASGAQTVAQECKTLTGKTLKEYIDDHTACGDDLALFAASRLLGVEICVFQRPEEGPRTRSGGNHAQAVDADKSWHSWLPADASSADEDAPRLYLAHTPGIDLFRSLKRIGDGDDEGEGEGGEDPAAGEGKSEDEDEDEDEDLEDRNLIPIGEWETDFYFVKCKACQKLRPIFGPDLERHRERERTCTSGEVPWQCTDTELLMVERDCGDASIWRKCYDWYLQTERGPTTFVKWGKEGTVLDLSHVFVMFQVYHEWNTFNRNLGQALRQKDKSERTRLLSIAACSLGSTSGGGRNPGNTLWEKFRAVFKISLPSKSGSSENTLERHLLEDEGVLATIEKYSGAVREAMGLPHMGPHLDKQRQGSEVPSPTVLPSIFVSPRESPARSENIMRILKQTHTAVNVHLERGVEAVRSGTLNSDFKQLADATRLAEKETACRRNVPFLGETGTGKSFLLDCVCRVSEQSRSTYESNNRTLRRKDLESVFFLREKQIRIQEQNEDVMQAQNSGGGSEEMMEDDTEDDDADSQQGGVGERNEDTEGRVFGPHSTATAFFSRTVNDAGQVDAAGKTIEQRENDSTRVISMFHKKPHDAEVRELAFKLPFLFPQSNTKSTDSTTSCSIIVRSSPRYQIALDFVSEEEILERWGGYDDAEESLQDRILEEVKSALRSQEDEDEEQKKERENLAEDLLGTGIESLDEHFPVLKRVAGKRFTFVGAGVSALYDRVFIRRILCSMQGIPDAVNKEGYNLDDYGSCDENDPEILSTFCGKKQIRFGRLTSPALRGIYVWGPFGMAPNVDGQLEDTAGCGDADPQKYAVLLGAMEKAETLVVVSIKALKGRKATKEWLSASKAMKRLVESVVKDENDSHTRVCVVDNRENRIHSVAHDTLCLEGAEGVGQSSHTLQKDEMENVPKIDEKDAEELEKISKGLIEADDSLDKVKVRELAKNCVGKVRLLHPAIGLATSLILDGSLENWTEEKKKELLDNTKVCGLFGTLEQFMERGSLKVITSVLNILGDDELPGLIAGLREEIEKSKEVASTVSAKTDAAEKDLYREWQKHMKDDLERPVRRLLVESVEEVRQNATAPELKNYRAELSNLKKTVLKLCEKKKPCAKNWTASDQLVLKTNLKVTCKALTDFWLKSLAKKLFESAGKEAAEGTFLHKAKDALHAFIKKMMEGDGVSSEDSKAVLDKAKSCMSPHLSFSKALKASLKKSAEKNHEGVFSGMSKRLFSDLTIPNSKRKQYFSEEFDSWASSFLATHVERVQNKIGKQFTDLHDEEGKHTLLKELESRMGLLPAHSERKKSKSRVPRILPDLANVAKDTAFRIGGKPVNQHNSLEALLDAKHAREIQEKMLKELEDLRDVLEGFSAGRRQGAKNCEETGRHLIEVFRRQRLIDYLDQNKGKQGTGQSLPDTSPDTARLIDATLPLSKSHNDAGYEPLNEKMSIEIVLAEAARCNYRKGNGCYNKIFSRMVVVNQQLRFNDPPAKKMPPADFLLKKYARIALEIKAQDLDTMDLRYVIARSAATEVSFNEDVKAVIESRYGGVQQYRQHIMSRDTYPDILALYLLVQWYKRPLNLYVSWRPNPLRIQPRGISDTDSPNADALVYMGFSQQHDGPNVFWFVECKLHANRGRATQEQGGRGLVAESESQDYEEMDYQQPSLHTPLGSRSASPVHVPAAIVASVYVRNFVTLKASVEKPNMSSQQDYLALRRSLAQFGERFLVCRGLQGKGPKPTGLERHDHIRDYRDVLPCDDACSHSENFVGLFDGVGQGGKFSGMLARMLARGTAQASSNKEGLMTQVLGRPPQNPLNRSFEIMVQAQNRVPPLAQQMKQEGLEHLNRHARTTSLILSLMSRPGRSPAEGARVHQLHELVHGDSQWALLRKIPAVGFVCEYLSNPLHHGNANFEHSDTLGLAPFQVSPTCNFMRNRDDKPYKGIHEVKHDDVIVAGSDGLFDNLLRLGRSNECSHAEKQRRTREHLAKFANDVTSEQHRSKCKVCRKLGGRPSVLCLGRHIEKYVYESMKDAPPRGKPDDVAIFVARVSITDDDLDGSAVQEIAQAAGNIKQQEMCAPRHYHHDWEGLLASVKHGHATFKSALCPAPFS